jgi:DNA-binding response OmpR family regulator
MRILIVDDEYSLLKQLKQIFEGQRYMVETATNGEGALDKLFETPFDLVILDIMMPKIDGLTVLERARKAGIDTQVLMLTAKGDAKDKVKGLDLGADDYLAKPFSLDELLARVRALLRRSSSQSEPAA